MNKIKVRKILVSAGVIMTINSFALITYANDKNIKEDISQELNYGIEQTIEVDSNNETKSIGNADSTNVIVDIPDPNLKSFLMKKLKKKENEVIHANELKSIYNLGLADMGITNIQGLEYCTNLDILDLSNNQISDLSPLSNLQKLKALYLGENQISNISPLSKLTSLDILEINNNQIEDIGPLATLTQLTFLMAFNNNITDISAMSHMSNLEIVKLDYNNISDLSPLSNLPKLKQIDMAHNNISDLSPLSSILSLEHVYFYGNQISDMSPLANLTNLTRINLTNNNISDISSLANSNLINLKEILLGGNNLSDLKGIDVLVDIPNLKKISLINNNISDTTPLLVFSNLEELNLMFNNISDISSIQGLVREGGDLNVMYQEIELDTMHILPGSSEKIILENPLRDKHGIVSDITSVNNNGIYDNLNNILTWDPISGVLYYDFRKDVSGGSGWGVFHGRVYQPVNYIPTISGAIDKTIKEGESFDPMDGISAADIEDDKWGAKLEIKISGDIVDTNVPGKYTVTYTVTDSAGGTRIVNRVVTVNPKMVQVNAAPTIEAADKVLKVGDTFNEKAGVTAEDKEDGNLTNSITVIKNTVNTNKEGTYEVVYEVSDKDGATVRKTITVIVRSNDKPIISGVDDVTIVQGTEFNKLLGVTAIDKEDDDLTTSIVVTGKVDINTPGKYELIYTVKDSDGNVAEVKRYITVKEKEAVVAQPTDREDYTDNVTIETLPQTGDESKLPIAGIVMILVGFILVFKKNIP